MEFSEKEKAEIKEIAKEIISQLKEEVENIEDRKERIALLNKIDKVVETLGKKSDKFLDNEELCTAENLEKLFNLYKQQEDFFDSVFRKANK